MPSSNGVYSLPAGFLATTGTTITVSQHNPIFEDVAAALTARLSRDGTAPMTGPINLAAGSVTAPGAVFAADPSSGFFKTTNGIGVSIGGTQTAEFLAGGINGARFIGELIPYTCTAAPALTVLPFGQTLSRITFAALWTQAQIEITNGNVFFNNGDGSTSFGIPDMRGRVPAGWDSMGGTAAGRLTTAGSGVNGAVLGSVGGLQGVTLNASQIPTIGAVNNSAPAYNLSNGPTSGGVTDIGVGGETTPGGGFGFNTVSSEGNVGVTGTITIGVDTISTLSTNTGGLAHPNVQPTFICNYLLYAGA
jgi:microcystin-dependent protein